MGLKILVVTGEFPSARAPFRASFNRQHLNALAEHHELELVCPVPWQDAIRGPQSLSDLLPPDNVSSDIAVSYASYWYPPGILRSTYDHWMWLSLRRRLLAIAARFQPDLVLGIWAYPDGATALKLARRIGVPAVIQVLGSDVNLLDEYPAKRRKTLQALTHADRVLTVSAALRDKLLAYEVPPEKVKVVYRGVNAELFYPRVQSDALNALGLDPQRKHVLFIGNLVPVKDPCLLVEAFLTAQLPCDTDLHILGDGPLRGTIEGLRENMEVPSSHGRVRLHGVVQHQDIPLWMTAVDLLVLSSVAEGVPNVLLEARSCGCPYLATRVGGVAEISDHEGASLVEAKDLVAMQAALVQALLAPRESRNSIPWQTWPEAGAHLAHALEGVLLA